MKKTELISLAKDKSEDPGFAVCYARGSVFRPEGNFFRVEVGKRTVVSRTLCVVQYHGGRCRVCPNSKFVVRFTAQEPTEEPDVLDDTTAGNGGEAT